MRARSRRIALLVIFAALVAVPVLVGNAGATLSTSNPPTFTFVSDENGADDQPGQKDLNAQAIATPTPGDLWVAWKWDVTGLSGGNTGDACALFDTNTNGNANFAICVTIAGSPATQLTSAGSPRVYTCGDGKPDRCTSTSAQVASINSACDVTSNAGDPFYLNPANHKDQKDTQATCHVDLADVGGANSALLLNTCSYPSQQPNSDPSDCVLVPRDAFIRVTKSAPTGSGPFPFSVDGGASFNVTPGTPSSYVPVRSDQNHSVAESVPTNWHITGTPSCSGSTSSGTNPNGTFSVNTISGIDPNPGDTITCTYTDAQDTGAIVLTKYGRNASCTGAATPSASCTGAGLQYLNGATFSLDGASSQSTSGSGTTCWSGLTVGSSYTVAETNAPSNWLIEDLDSGASGVQSSKSVSVTSAGTCSSGAAAVSFTDSPKSAVEVKFTSSAGSGVSAAQIECKQGTTTVAADAENGTADTSGPNRDDSDETFSGLAAGVYTCTVDINP